MPINFDCPLCGQALSVTESPGSTYRCTGCSGLLRVPKTSQPKSADSSPADEPDIPMAEPDPPSELDAIAQIQTAGRRGKRGHGGQGTSGRSSVNRAGQFVRSNPRLTRNVLYYMIRFLPLALWFPAMLIALLLLDDPADYDPNPILLVLGCGGVPLLIIYHFVGRFLATYVLPQIMALLITSVRCPACGERKSLVAVWVCSCGFHDYRQRHAYRFNCPNCPCRGIDYTTCNRCEATVLI